MQAPKFKRSFSFWRSALVGRNAILKHCHDQWPKRDMTIHYFGLRLVSLGKWSDTEVRDIAFHITVVRNITPVRKYIFVRISNAWISFLNVVTQLIRQLGQHQIEKNPYGVKGHPGISPCNIYIYIYIYWSQEFSPKNHGWWRRWDDYGQWGLTLEENLWTKGK